MKEWIAANPELVSVLVLTVIWPIVTAVVSLGQDAIKARWPGLWTLLQATGLDLLGAVRAVMAKKLPPGAVPPSEKP